MNGLKLVTTLCFRKILLLRARSAQSLPHQSHGELAATNMSGTQQSPNTDQEGDKRCSLPLSSSSSTEVASCNVPISSSLEGVKNAVADKFVNLSDHSPSTPTLTPSQVILGQITTRADDDPSVLGLLTIHQKDYDRVRKGEWWNDTIIRFRLVTTWKQLEREYQDSIWIAESYFATKLMENAASKDPSPDDAFKSMHSSYWSSRISEKTRLIVLPLNDRNYHWMLVAVFLPLYACKDDGENKQEEEDGMFILLDSMQSNLEGTSSHTPSWWRSNNRHKLMSTISTWINTIAAPKLLRKVALHVMDAVNVPAQENSYDCGIYVVKFAEALLRHYVTQVHDKPLQPVTPSTIITIDMPRISQESLDQERYYTKELLTTMSTQWTSTKASEGTIGFMTMTTPVKDVSKEKGESSSDEEVVLLQLTPTDRYQISDSTFSSSSNAEKSEVHPEVESAFAAKSLNASSSNEAVVFNVQPHNDFSNGYSGEMHDIQLRHANYCNCSSSEEQSTGGEGSIIVDEDLISELELSVIVEHLRTTLEDMKQYFNDSLNMQVPLDLILDPAQKRVQQNAGDVARKQEWLRKWMEKFEKQKERNPQGVVRHRYKTRGTTVEESEEDEEEDIMEQIITQYVDTPTSKKSTRNVPIVSSPKFASPSMSIVNGMIKATSGYESAKLNKKRKKDFAEEMAPMIKTTGVVSYGVTDGSFPLYLHAERPIFCCCSKTPGHDQRRMVNNLDFWCETCQLRHLAGAESDHCARDLFISRCGWHFARMEDDGDCFFHCITTALTKTHESFSSGRTQSTALDMVCPSVHQMRTWWAQQITEDYMICSLEELRCNASRSQYNGTQALRELYKAWLRTLPEDIVPKKSTLQKHKKNAKGSNSNKKGKRKADEQVLDDEDIKINYETPLPQGEDLHRMTEAFKEYIRKDSQELLDQPRMVVWADQLAIRCISAKLRLRIFILDQQVSKRSSPYTTAYDEHDKERQEQFIGSVFLRFNGRHFDLITWTPPCQKLNERYKLARQIYVFPPRCYYPQMLQEMWCALNTTNQSEQSLLKLRVTETIQTLRYTSITTRTTMNTRKRSVMAER